MKRQGSWTASAGRTPIYSPGTERTNCVTLWCDLARGAQCAHRSPTPFRLVIDRETEQPTHIAITVQIRKSAPRLRDAQPMIGPVGIRPDRFLERLPFAKRQYVCLAREYARPAGLALAPHFQTSHQGRQSTKDGDCASHFGSPQARGALKRCVPSKCRVCESARDPGKFGI